MNKTKIIAEPGKQELIITRDFDAPRELVFRAFIDPDLYVKWLGPRRLTMKLVTFEPRSGGSWRYVQKGEDGQEHAFHGVYHEVSAPERIINTFEYEGLPESGHVILETMRFEALPDGRTRLVAHSLYPSMADRDGMIQAGMEEGVVDSYERLEELMTELKKVEATL